MKHDFGISDFLAYRMKVGGWPYQCLWFVAKGFCLNFDP